MTSWSVEKETGGKQAGTVNDDLVEHIDLATTSLALAGIAVPEHLQGNEVRRQLDLRHVGAMSIVASLAAAELNLCEKGLAQFAALPVAAVVVRLIPDEVVVGLTRLALDVPVAGPVASVLVEAGDGLDR